MPLTSLRIRSESHRTKALAADHEPVVLTFALVLAVALDLAFAVALSAVFASPASAQDRSADWPQFRGLDRDGTSPASGLAIPWPEEGPKVVWRRPIGSGFSGLAVSAGKLYTMFTSDGREIAAAFDSATGKELWRKEIGPVFESEFGHGPRSTPTVGSELAYYLGGNGRLVALANGDGGLRWEVDLPRDFRSVPPMHGYSTAPILDGDHVIVEIGGGQGKAFAAFDAASGKLDWTAGDGSASYTSPIAISLFGERHLVSLDSQHVYGFSPQGAVLWQHPLRGGIAMPLHIPPDRLFISDGRAGAVLVKVVRKGDEISAEEVWSSTEMKNHFNSSVVHDGYVFGFDNSTLKAISLEDGSRAWAERGLGRGSLILVDGYLLVLAERGELVVARASGGSFDAIGRFQALEGKSWTPPTLAGGFLYLRNLEEMVSLDLRRP